MRQMIAQASNFDTACVIRFLSVSRCGVRQFRHNQYIVGHPPFGNFPFEELIQSVFIDGFAFVGND